MRSYDEIQEIIKRQDEANQEIEKIQKEIEELEYDMKLFLESLPNEELLKDLLSEENYADSDPYKIMINSFKLFYDKREEIDILLKNLNGIPGYSNFLSTQEKYNKLKLSYFNKLFKYCKMIENDREEIFDANYMGLMDKLADRGLFLYFLETPDIPIYGMDVEDAEKFVLNSFLENGCGRLIHFLHHVIENKSYNELRKNKTNDLREAIECLINGLYQSCARTVCALLENEHKNASNLYKQSKGIERSKEIDKYVKAIRSKYFSKAWKKLNVFYKEINCNTEKMDMNTINRNDLMHGTYKHIASAYDCIKLIFAYLSFKEVSFYIQEKIEFQTLLTREFLSFILEQELGIHEK